MAATDEDDDPKPKGDEPKDEGSKDEAKSVSLDEHVSLRKKKNARIEELEAEVAKLKDKQEPKPKDEPDKPDWARQLEKTQEELVARDRNRALQAQLGLTKDQAEEVAKLIKESGGVLEPQEALNVCKARDPEKFDSQEAPAPQHGQLRPRSGPKPEPKQEDTLEEQLQYAESLRGKDKRAHNKHFNNIVGGFAAAAMGREHQKLPIPKKK